MAVLLPGVKRRDWGGCDGPCVHAFITRVCAIKGTLRAAAGMFFVFFSCVSSCVLGEGIFVGRQSPVLMLL